MNPVQICQSFLKRMSWAVILQQRSSSETLTKSLQSSCWALGPLPRKNPVYYFCSNCTKAQQSGSINGSEHPWIYVPALLSCSVGIESIVELCAQGYIVWAIQDCSKSFMLPNYWPLLCLQWKGVRKAASFSAVLGLGGYCRFEQEL